MKVIVKNSGAIGNNLDLLAIREPSDQGMVTLIHTVCVKDSSGTVVYSQSFNYSVGYDPDVKEYTFDVSTLNEGVYTVDIYQGADCNPPPNTLIPVKHYTYYIHKVSYRSSLVMGGFWNYDNNRWLVLYVYNGKLFWVYDMNVSGVPIPVNIPVYVEVVDGDGSGFVGSVTSSSMYTYIEPNIKVPFMATFTIKLDQPRARDFMLAIRDTIGFMYGATVQLVDDYTFNIVFVKTEPGAYAIALIFIAAVALILGYLWYDVNIKEVNYKTEVLSFKREVWETVKPVFDIARESFNNYKNEVSQCPKGDMQCVLNAQAKWMPFTQAANALAGQAIANIMTMQQQPAACDGLRLGGVCVPWWVVAVAIFLAGLLVIAAVK
jgi:hypothetical protein